MKRLAVCMLNVSEARNTEIVENIARAAVNYSATQELQQRADEQTEATVLNIFNDFDYNRSVLTIAAPTCHLGNSLYCACKKAYELVDLSDHSGGHPRLGSVDLVPIHPLSDDVTLDECGEIARGLALRLAEDIPGTSFFLFGHADQPHCRGLVERRKEVKWYSGRHGYQQNQLKYDIGAAPTSQYGLTGIGAIPYMMNCNVTMDTDDLQSGREVAVAIRGSSPGCLPGVQAMAFRHQGKVEIACNVQSYLFDDRGQRSSGNMAESAGAMDTNSPMIESHDKQTGRTKESIFDELHKFGRHAYIPGEIIESRIRELAASKGISIEGRALLGFEPKKALELATQALSNGETMFWKGRHNRNM